MPTTIPGSGPFTVPSLSLSGGQIAFPATQVSSSDPNTLDDYEEGTWTPNVVAVSGAYTTVTNQAGTYVKIGRQVTVSFRFIVTNKGTGATGALIDNAPFSCAVSAVGSGFNTSSAVGSSVAVTAGTTNLAVYKYDGTDPVVATNQINGTVTYFV